MSHTEVYNVNVASQDVLVTPAKLKQALPISAAAHAQVAASREAIENILDRKDHRLFVVVGPCSIHDVDAAMEYAGRLKALANELQDTLY
ncbi:MAG: 3-deoxy-7-phosphoheptulonate synthase, partial [Haliea sp.]|nr:3-deoxy-7-phosphoheptulonate synthase [Haliea sp.]